MAFTAHGFGGRRRLMPALNPFVILGLLFLLGLVADLVARRTRVPRVTLLVALGFAVGPRGLGLLPGAEAAWVEWLSRFALIMIGFLIGGTLTRRRLARHGRAVVGVSLSIVVLTAAFVLVALPLVGVAWVPAVLLAAIASATDPAATREVLEETEARGPFSSTLTGVIAIDDAWGLVVFSIAMAVVAGVGGGGIGAALREGAVEILGALLIGVVLGLVMALLTGRLLPGRPMQAEALGFVLLCGGVAIWIRASFLLAAIVLGVVVANLARHHDRPFHEMEGIEWPFLIVFFLFAGSLLDPATLAAAGFAVLAYIVARVLGRIAGGVLGVRLARDTSVSGGWLGVALLPQAGIALGMMVVAVERFPEHRDVIVPIAVGATVLFEVIGPLGTWLAVRRAGEAGAGRDPA